MKDPELESFISAYKEKMKELSMLSLICSCFYPEPRNINIYTYDGELPAVSGNSAAAWIVQSLLNVCLSLMAPDRIKPVFVDPTIDWMLVATDLNIAQISLHLMLITAH